MRNLSKAFDLCCRHPVDPKILETTEPGGVEALVSNDVKAVILRRALPRPVLAVMQAMTPTQLARLHATCGQLKAQGRFDPSRTTDTLRGRDIFNAAADAEAVGAYVEDLAATIGLVTPDYKKIYSWFHGQLRLTPRYHVDTIDVVRGSVVMKGTGMRILTADLAPQDYAAICSDDRHPENEALEARYPHETLVAGDVAFTKSKKDGGLFGATQSLGHRTVSTPEEGQSRVFCGIDLYKPVF